MKTIGVYFDAPAFDGYPFDDADYKKAYHELAQLLADEGAECIIVRDPSTHLSGNTFRGGWKYGQKQFERFEEEVTPNVIYNKGQHLKADSASNYVNDPAFDALCTNKWETYKRFTPFFPVSKLLQSQEDVIAAGKELKGKILAAKPLNEEGGEGVIITKREKVLSSIPSFPYLLQELIDTSNGIPGLVAGKHDLRMMSINGEILSVYARLPRGDSYVSNYNLGGEWQEMELKKLPEGAHEIFRKIDKDLSTFPDRVYALDVGLDKSGEWKIFELNSRPGLSCLGMHEGATEFMMKLRDLLLAHA